MKTIDGRRFISAEAVILLFPELATKLNELPCQLEDGHPIYDSIAALDLVVALNPPVWHNTNDETSDLGEE